MGVSRIDYNSETLIDISNDTVTPQTLAKGFTAHNSNGEQIVGTMPTSSGSHECTLMVEAVFDLTTMSILSVSHTYDEIFTALQEGKQILFKADNGLSITYGQLVAYIPDTSRLFFQLMVQNDFGYGTMLYYFNVILRSDNSTFVNAYTVTTTGLGG